MLHPRSGVLCLALLGAVALGCGGGGGDGARGRPKPVTNAIPYPPAAAPATSSATTAPVTTPSAPTPPAGALTVEVTGPGPARAAVDAAELLALAATLTNTGAEELLVDALLLRASGSLDDATGIATARLALDVDGDGAFDRAIDRVLASAGVTTDDGPLELRPVPLPLAAGASARLLVTLDLSGAGHPAQDVRLLLGAPAVLGRTVAGGPLVVRATPTAGPALTLGPWVAPFESVELTGTAEGLSPRARRDAQGRTHLAIYQNLNGRSSVFYSLDDGRRWSPPDDVADAASRAWIQDLAVDAAGLPVTVWEEVRVATPNDQIYLSRFDPVAFAWTPKERVSTSPDGGANARVAATRLPGGVDVIDVVWEEKAPGQDPKVMHRRLAGGAWSGVADVGSSAAGALAREPVLAHTPSGDLLVAWCEAGTGQVRTRTLSPAGAWGPVAVAAVAQGVVERTALLVDGATTALAFVDGGDVFVVRPALGVVGSPVNVSRSPLALSDEPTLAMWQGALHVVWIEEVAGGGHVAHAVAQGGGFGPPELLTAGQGNVSRRTPCLVPEGDRLRVLWQDRRLGRQRIFETWQQPGGLEAPRVAAAPGGDPARPDVALAPDGALHVVFAVDAGGNQEVFHAAAPAPGAPFAAAENLSRSPTGSHAPAIAAPGDGLVVAWEEAGAIVRAERGAAGSVWSSPAVVSSGSPAYAPRLAGAPDGRAALVWSEQVAPGDHDLRLARRDASGRWSPATPLAPRAGASAWSPDVALGAQLAVIWEEEQPGRREVWTAVIDAAGATTVAAVASSGAGQYAPRLAWSGAELWATWVEDGRARVARRPAGAATFDPPVDLTTSGAWSPSIAASGGLVVATFERWTGSDARVLQATLGATGWSAPTPLDRSAGPARRVASAGTSTGGVVAAWTEPGRVVVREGRGR